MPEAKPPFDIAPLYLTADAPAAAWGRSLYRSYRRAVRRPLPDDDDDSATRHTMTATCDRVPHGAIADAAHAADMRNILTVGQRVFEELVALDRAATRAELAAARLENDTPLCHARAAWYALRADLAADDAIADAWDAVKRASADANLHRQQDASDPTPSEGRGATPRKAPPSLFLEGNGRWAETRPAHHPSGTGHDLIVGVQQRADTGVEYPISGSIRRYGAREDALAAAMRFIDTGR